MTVSSLPRRGVSSAGIVPPPAAWLAGIFWRSSRGVVLEAGDGLADAVRQVVGNVVMQGLGAAGVSAVRAHGIEPGGPRRDGVGFFIDVPVGALQPAAQLLDFGEQRGVGGGEIVVSQ